MTILTSAVVHVLPSSTTAWARFCLLNPTASIHDFQFGFELLNGPHAAEWLQRGLPAMLKAIRNSEGKRL